MRTDGAGGRAFVSSLPLVDSPGSSVCAPAASTLAGNAPEGASIREAVHRVHRQARLVRRAQVNGSHGHARRTRRGYRQRLGRECLAGG